MKRSVAVVSIETILSEVSTEDVIEAVVVVVADANAICPADRLQSCFLRHVGECAVAIVLVEPIGRFRRIALEPRARKQKDIHPAVVVVVDECAATPVGLEDVLLRVHAAVDDGRVQARLVSDVGKMRVERPPGRRRLRLGLHVAGGDSLCLPEEPLGSRTQRKQDEGTACDGHQDWLRKRFPLSSRPGIP